MKIHVRTFLLMLSWALFALVLSAKMAFFFYSSTGSKYVLSVESTKEGEKEKKEGENTSEEKELNKKLLADINYYQNYYLPLSFYFQSSLVFYNQNTRLQALLYPVITPPPDGI